MVPKKQEGDAQSHAVGNLAAAPLPPKSGNPHADVVSLKSDEEYCRSPPIAIRKAIISMGVIDEKSFTRECIIRSLQALDDRLSIVSYPTSNDCLQDMKCHDLILYNAHGAIANWDANNEQLLSLKRLLNTVPVIILSDIDCPDSLVEMFESGARGFIPTTNTTLEQIIEIIALVKVGGIFVPLSSLSLLNNKGQGITARLASSDHFTSNELAVLDRLKLGKTNKIIAHELGLSESTVKVHIGRIMKKLKVTNRTQVVSRAYTLAVAGNPSSGKV
jgi:DNA-binding NarL/FixJ family response regulator